MQVSQEHCRPRRVYQTRLVRAKQPNRADVAESVKLAALRYVDEARDQRLSSESEAVVTTRRLALISDL